MRIRVDITQEDIWHLRRQLVKTDPNARKRKRRSLLAIVFYPTLLSVVLSFPLHSSLFVAVTIGVVITLILYGWFFWEINRRIKRLPIKGPGILGEHNFELTSEWFREWTDVNDLTCKWVTVERVDQDDRYIYIVGTSGWYIIPKRAFTSDAEAHAFFEEALSFWKSAADHSK